MNSYFYRISNNAKIVCYEIFTLYSDLALSFYGKPWSGGKESKIIKEHHL